MSVRFIAVAPDRYAGQSVGNGQCVAFVRAAADAPHTATWHRGDNVRRSFGVAKGTAIATFDANGRYGNHADGRSHAAILIAFQDDGLLVWDQWPLHPVQQRAIRFRGGAGDAVNDGDSFHVIEAEP